MISGNSDMCTIHANTHMYVRTYNIHILWQQRQWQQAAHTVANTQFDTIYELVGSLALFLVHILIWILTVFQSQHK